MIIRFPDAVFGVVTELWHLFWGNVNLVAQCRPTGAASDQANRASNTLLTREVGELIFSEPTSTKAKHQDDDYSKRILRTARHSSGDSRC